ncbi:SDR family NAD(P)-dependent oxidoreductase, partial [Enterococcus faecalis]|nr:SDR family NAD(P)-dependent oxidoreductase [Enterococcus faecalis]
ILVTGASGFIGSSLVEKLVLEGYEVTALVKYNSSSNIGNLSKIPKEILSNITIVFGDIRDAIQMNRLLKDISIVYNLAALISIPYSYNAVESYINTNLIGCKNLMEACISNNVELFVQTSTSEVYGTAIADKIDENHRMLGQSPYAASKIAADQFVQSYFCSYGLPSIIVRPFNTFGPRQSLRAFIPNMIYQIMKHDEIKVGNVQTTRDYTFIDDTVSGFYEAMKIKNRDATAYN